MEMKRYYRYDERCKAIEMKKGSNFYPLGEAI